MSANIHHHAFRILVVEDNDADVRLLQEAFRESGAAHHLEVVRDGEQAIEYLMRCGGPGKPHPDLVLLDLNLPRRSGHEVLEVVKLTERLSHIPVVVFSSSIAEPDVNKAYALRANSYIQKPSSLDKFFATVRQLQAFWMHRATVPSGW